MPLTSTADSTRAPHRKQGAIRWMFLFACILAATLLYLALRGLNWTILGQILRRAQLHFVAAALLTTTFSYWLRSARWRVLLSAERRVPLAEVFWATIAGYLGNNFLPARAGEILRSAMLGRSSGLGTSFVLATALSERILDAATLVVIGIATSSTISVASHELRRALVLMGGVGLVGILTLVVVSRFESWISRLLARLPMPAKLRAPVGSVLTRFLSGMRACQDVRLGLQFAILTAAIWLTDAVGACLIAKSIGLALSIPQALFVLSALGLSSALPSTPGYLGVYQFVTVSVMPLFGYTQEQALAYILLAQAAGYAVIALLGIPTLWYGRTMSSPKGQVSSNR